ncbi:inosine-uridine preferring nucleoside hydrolase-like protein [Mollisia scopiformis]|uniref:Inosine-uridine preferring nucleoside hydrolase-like protein n=1 Tax=Mollisia scopiformis TaxID=149040 RepID=A0A194XJH8_MOLSC|nr:inosine-uridine preferring nucleoside hydrolase-like protein [Mollisia scopiformis]KUJ20279.1 inosine-uridine preferring nucleoside hydrolase-like protein [Mollisia scopiformis]
MAPLNRIIIDTDPGVDDVLAMLLALAAKPEELEVLLLSVTYGNVEVQSCLRNVVALFHVLEKEMEWRRARGQLEGFGCMTSSKPIVAVGADHPLEDEILMADYFHGVDGLAGVHTSHPHLSPSDAWKTLFQPPQANATTQQVAEARELATPITSFRASQVPAHKEILRLLKENPRDTITIVAVGPMTNLALAAAEDTETFLRVKEVVVMGGAIDVEGNITPVAEFNTYADAVATARVFALTSPTPSSTMPPPPLKISKLPPYPTKLSRQLKLTLFSLDLTTPHTLQRSHLMAKLDPLIKQGSPLAEWTSAFVNKTYEKIESLTRKQLDPGLELHDPLTIWYMLTREAPQWMGAPKGLEDIRVETAGQWTRGMHIIDRRNRKKGGAPEQIKSPGAVDIANPMEQLVIPNADGEGGDAPGDNGGWLAPHKGNRINRIVGSPGEEFFGPYLLERVFG